VKAWPRGLTEIFCAGAIETIAQAAAGLLAPLIVAAQGMPLACLMNVR
jgi:hypothetical protein